MSSSRPQPADIAQRPERCSRQDEFGALLQRLAPHDPSNEIVAERWTQLSQRIRVYNQLQALRTHMLTYRTQVRCATLLMRTWSSLTMPIA